MTTTQKAARQRTLRNVPDPLWQQFSGRAKLYGMTQVEYLRLLVKLDIDING